MYQRSDNVSKPNLLPTGVIISVKPFLQINIFSDIVFWSFGVADGISDWIIIDLSNAQIQLF